MPYQRFQQSLIQVELGSLLDKNHPSPGRHDGGFLKSFMKIGIIQTRGIGDIIIALPIAAYFHRNGHEVIWPIDARFYDAFKKINSRITFVPVPHGNDEAYYLSTPLKILKEYRCDVIHCLYHQLGTAPISHPGLAACLKFDEYKYALTGVPFQEKWNLKINRDLESEKTLFTSLAIQKKYICIHSVGSEYEISDLALPPHWRETYQIINIDCRTSSVFDWIYTLEQADKLVLVDSCVANLVEQLNLPNEKYFLLRSPIKATPVMKNGWKFISPAHNFVLPEKNR